MNEFKYTLLDLLRVMQRLRDPETGCPWDLAQDFRTIVPSTLEEVYELAHAIEHDDFGHVAEELGDVLFQVVFYSQLGKEQHLFCFNSIVDTLVQKLVRRHPHVFALGAIDGVVADRVSAEDVKQTWEAIKQSERHARSQSGVLADIPLALPALSRAQKVQKRAAAVHFDWTDAASVVEKLQEEMAELRVAMSTGDDEAARDELGDVLFTCVNLARHLGLDAEGSLRHATDKFERRFQHMETAVARHGGAIADLTPAQWDQLWDQAKQVPGGGKPGL
jgi:ATP diphosphatase